MRPFISNGLLTPHFQSQNHLDFHFLRTIQQTWKHLRKYESCFNYCPADFTLQQYLCQIRYGVMFHFFIPFFILLV